MPGFGEVHKHIESSHVTPEGRRPLSPAAMATPGTCEASHEFSNVNGARTLSFGLIGRGGGQPAEDLSACPLPPCRPRAYEWAGGISAMPNSWAFLGESLIGWRSLDEVMDWPAVWGTPLEPVA